MSLASQKASQLTILKDRAQMLSAARAFFAERGVMEVDTPLLSSMPSIDAHIDLVECRVGGQRRYLVSSPEYRMKELLAQGSGDIYQLSHVFRDNEEGERHRPEFTMVEWYRLDFSIDELIAETAQFLELFLGERVVRALSYRDLFAKHASLDVASATEVDLRKVLSDSCVEVPASCASQALESLILGCVIEPNLPQEEITVVHSFPEREAALAEVRGGVAMRFELYCRGLELANGYLELRDGDGYRARLERANKERREPLPLDEGFLQAMTWGLPLCCGVSVGFDRLMMARHGAEGIEEILPLALHT